MLAPPPLPSQPLPWPPAPWTHIQVDICGELHGIPQHQRFLLVASLSPTESKWPEVLPAGSVTTEVVIGFLSSLFARWGVPNAITMDNGFRFISAGFTAFTTGGWVKHIRTALYHPQKWAHIADGLSFASALQSTLLHCRTAPHTTTGSSPALLMLGREPQLPLNRLHPPVEEIPERTPGPATGYESSNAA